MIYLSLYRKYRPQNFQNIIGQDIIVKTLQNAIKYCKINHCYLFSGDKGVGKTTLAKNLAKAINCCNNTCVDCCNTCKSCISINQRNNLDLIEIDGASYNGVDEIRELQDTSKYKPIFGKYKIYIIDEVHVLSYNAFNALLKLLEDPPSKIIFILITSEFNKIPKTIISRTQHFGLKHITVEDIRKQLKFISVQENIDIHEDALNQIAIFSKGSMRDALNRLEQVSTYYHNSHIGLEEVSKILGLVSKDKIKELINYLLNSDFVAMIDFLENLLQPHVDVLYFMEDLIDFFLTLFIKGWQKDDNNFTTIFKNLNIKVTNQFFVFLFHWKNNIKHTVHKKKYFIINCIQLKQFLLPYYKEQDNLNNQKKIIYDNSRVNSENCIYETGFLSSSETMLTTSCLKNVSKSFNSNLFTCDCANFNDFTSSKTVTLDSFLYGIKQILITPDLSMTKKLIQKWYQLTKIYDKNLEMAALCLYKSKLCLINLSKDWLISCANTEEYQQLLKPHIKNKIKTILNKKNKLIKEYFVILHQDWEHKLLPLFQQYQKTRHICDLKLLKLDVDFYLKHATFASKNNFLINSSVGALENVPLLCSNDSNNFSAKNQFFQLAIEYFGMAKVRLK
ncbi:DNA polymerase III subunit gamma/tau [Candidatus Phytoplasma fabacearum]|uniref:DNA polymerase III subunit gamma/tau n=1 Tax=Candidatus Phytoplasma fabacearum TaxID=2982628 RepID=UPI0027138DFE|nr:DNA polymerase III subunit gamma/tau ['Bituminaria bituminosa' little leaf phytoplasma]MDV3148594.1 DNA polymerase III subunit gamma/tau [Pigeon pea little leaf phytoplasma]MDO7983580.1 DNA polymerase III subunit gamma/tau ['Bituminaria bituminosa' little leaf phytoplasma]MDO8030550.1 DNA polymerase III subunit gamma/tau ['Bituminaria bituminosa' little leaf phytoplasma]MDV3154184.1 DNA polymerase III subunit gamma/tau [Pigeon pea little leaf phytoplasma]MDV3163349.1 DNA polymerase III subu